MPMPRSGEVVVAGAASVLGKIGTVPNAGTLFVRCPCTPEAGNINTVLWRVQCNQTHAIQLYRATALVDSVAMTLNALDATDTIVINGLTFEGKAGAAAPATRKYSIDTGDTETALSLAACINNATYGVPGVLATPAAAVVTLTATTATVIQAVVGTADVGECGIVRTILPGLVMDGAAVTAIGSNSAYSGTFYSHTVNGFPQAYIGVTNSSGGAAATVVVGSTRY